MQEYCTSKIRVCWSDRASYQIDSLVLLKPECYVVVALLLKEPVNDSIHQQDPPVSKDTCYEHECK